MWGRLKFSVAYWVTIWDVEGWLISFLDIIWCFRHELVARRLHTGWEINALLFNYSNREGEGGVNSCFPISVRWWNLLCIFWWETVAQGWCNGRGLVLWCSTCDGMWWVMALYGVVMKSALNSLGMWIRLKGCKVEVKRLELSKNDWRP